MSTQRIDPDDRTRLKEYALLAPRLVRLIFRLMKDPRVPARPKAMIVMLGVYFASPIDLIPDFLPGVGHLDDLILAALALDQILNRVPEELVKEHWEGDEDILEVVRDVLDIASGLIPERIRRRFRG